jgi:hypothetical protein
MPTLADVASIGPTPRNKGWGTVADLLSYIDQNALQQQFGYRNPVTGLISEAVGIPAAARVANRLSYGQPVTNINQANVPIIPQDTAEAVMLAAPIAGQYAKFAGKQVAKMVDQAVNEGTGPLAKTVGTSIARMLPPQKYVGAQLKGLPSKVDIGGRLEEFGTDQRLVDLAKQFVADRGFVYVPQTKYATVDPNRATRLAEAYQKMANSPNDPKVKKAYDALIEETMGQYEALRKKGYKFDFMPESGDVYGNPRNAINDIVQNKRLLIFPTEQGFGSLTQASEANPLLMKIGEKWNGKEVTANDVFRAVHDVFGHAKHGVGFRAGGEENAYQAHARMYSPTALPAVTSETRGQNSWVNYGPYGAQNRIATPENTIYAEQKTGVLPSWAWKQGIEK